MSSPEVAHRSAAHARSAVAPHPLVATIDWDAATREAAEALSTYVRIDSAHPAGRTVETAAFLAERLAADGIESKVYRAGPEEKVHLVARLRAERPMGKPLLLSHHMDVVPAVPDDWSFAPFSGEIADGYVYGRGALDDKGMGVMELMALLLLRRGGAPLGRDVILLCSCDEEVRSEYGARFMVDHHFDDLDPAFMLDEGGSGMRGFYSAGDVFEVTVGQKQSLPIRLVARAEPGHGSTPWDGAAPHRLVRAAHALLTRQARERTSPPVAEMIRRLGGHAAREELFADRATRALLQDTISLTMLSGGYTVNVIPEQAEMTFDCRLLPDTDARAFVSDIERLIDDPNVAVEATLPKLAPVASAWDGVSLFDAVEQACRAHVPRCIVTPSLCVGGTDSHFFRQRGVPAYGLVPCLFTAEDLRGYHGVDERLSLENLRLGMQVLFDIVARVAVHR